MKPASFSAHVGILLLTLILTLTHALSASAGGCWGAKEKSIWAHDEMNGVLTLSFKNALNCKPVPDARLLLNNQEFLTNANGLVRIPAPADLIDATLSMQVSAEGYQKAEGYLVFAFNAPLQSRFLLSPRLTTDRARFVLSWAETPRDLDLHLVGPGFHVSYQNMKNAPNEAQLDRDSLNGHGPETITASNLKADAVYAVWVQNYSNEKPMTRGAQVQIYLADGSMQAVLLPATRARWVKIGEIDRGELKIAVQTSASGPTR